MVKGGECVRRRRRFTRAAEAAVEPSGAVSLVGAPSRPELSGAPWGGTTAGTEVRAELGRCQGGGGGHFDEAAAPRRS